MDFMDFSRRLYRWASEGVDMYVYLRWSRHPEFDTCQWGGYSHGIHVV